MKLKDQSNYQMLVEDVKKLQQAFTDEERLEFWTEITEGYCAHCGANTPDTVCNCMRDE